MEAEAGTDQIGEEAVPPVGVVRDEQDGPHWYRRHGEPHRPQMHRRELLLEQPAQVSRKALRRESGRRGWWHIGRIGWGQGDTG